MLVYGHLHQLFNALFANKKILSVHLSAFDIPLDQLKASAEEIMAVNSLRA